MILLEVASSGARVALLEALTRADRDTRGMGIVLDDFIVRDLRATLPPIPPKIVRPPPELASVFQETAPNRAARRRKQRLPTRGPGWNG